MSLIKKTVVLSGTTTKGYITIVSIGTSVGVKVVLSEDCHEPVLGLKIGKNDLWVMPLKFPRTEFEPKLEMNQNDDINCIVVSEGKLFATGGKRDYINIKDVTLLKEEPVVLKKEALTSVEALAQIPDSHNDIISKANTAQGVTQNQKIDELDVKAKSATTNGKNSSQKPLSEQGLPWFKQEKNKNFYRDISDQLQEMLVIYPREESLCRLVPDSEWVRINYDADEYYAVGVLKDADKITHICYGVPGIEGLMPPAEALGVCDWLPLGDKTNLDKGYWLLFQDASTGMMLSNE